jgi:hypothetical protein
MDRRQSLGLLGGIAISLAWAKAASATTARAVSLPDLVQRSSRIVRGAPLDSFARSEDVGGSHHIVTYSRLRVDEAIRGDAPESEILVRTLGGTLGAVGEIVHGEAELALNEPCIVFLHNDAQGVELVTAMAQGHYPLALDARGAPHLRASRNMPHLVRGSSSPSAVEQLTGLGLDEARALILGARH